MRKARDRVVGMKLSPKGTHLVCHVSIHDICHFDVKADEELCITCVVHS